MRATEKRNEDIRDDYRKMDDKKMYSHDYICGQLALKYYLNPTTIHHIITGNYPHRKIPKAIYPKEKITNATEKQESTQQKLF